MGDLVSTNPILNDPVEQRELIKSPEAATSSLSKINKGALKLSPFPSYSFTTQFAGMSASPASARRRATLTPSQAFQHASVNFFAPEPRGHEDWVYRSTGTILEASYSGSSPSSNKSSSDLAAVATPAMVTTNAYESHPPAAPSSSVVPAHIRPRAYSHSQSSNSDNPGVYYSSAHRRVPSSPSFRAPSLPHPHSYFDRPPSPTSSISSRWSEPPMSGSLSLSELIVGTGRMSIGDYGYTPEDERARREEQRESRKQGMLERHAALIEQREKRRWTKVAREGCIEWVENNTEW